MQMKLSKILRSKIWEQVSSKNKRATLLNLIFPNTIVRRVMEDLNLILGRRVKHCSSQTRIRDRLEEAVTQASYKNHRQLNNQYIMIHPNQLSIVLNKNC